MKITRPTWTELRRLQTTTDFDAAAARLFGDAPPRNQNEKPKPYTALQYRVALGIDIQQYEGFFAEVGHADAPEGPVTPATDRLPIRPILAIRRSRRGNYYVVGLEFPGGLFNRDKTAAWIKTEDYDALLGDDYFDRVEQQLQDLIDEADKTASDRPVQLVDLGGLDARERAIFDKIHNGVDFADLTAAERDIIATAMKPKGTPVPLASIAEAVDKSDSEQ